MNQIDSILAFIKEVTNFDVFQIADMIRSNKLSLSGSLRDFELREPLVDGIRAYMQGDDDAAIERLHTFLKQFLGRRITDLSVANIQILRGSVEYLKLCEAHQTEWTKKVRQELGIIYNPKDQFTAFTLFKMRQSIGSEHFKLYHYKGDGNLGKCYKFTIADTIVASSEISDLISQSQNDMWRVTMGLYIEEQISLSYFILSFSYKGNTYILSDKIDYTNPDQIRRVHNGGRRLSENRESALEMPYILIDKIQEKRAENYSLTKPAQREIYTFPIAEYVSWRLFYYCRYTIEAINQGTAQISRLNQKALSAPVDIADNSLFENNSNEEKLEKIVSEIFSDTCTNLVVQTSEILAANNVNTTLMTTEDVQRFSQYLVHKQIVENHLNAKCNIPYISWKNDFGKYIESNRQWEKFKQSQYEEFISLFKSRSEMLLPYLFCGDIIHITDVDHPNMYGSFDKINALYPREEDIFVTQDYDLGTIEISDIVKGECMCIGNCTKKANDKYIKTFAFKRYTEIITLLGISRNELPSLYRDYLAYRYIPYAGNSILHNIKPEYTALETDYISHRYPNSMDICFSFCGNCYRKFKKQYRIGNEVLIEISSKQKKVLQIKAL